MDTAQSRILNLLRKENGPNHTHVTFYHPEATWVLPSVNTHNFWVEWCNIIDSDAAGHQVLSVGEKPSAEMPVMAEFKIRFPSGGNHSDFYDENFLATVVHCYQSVIAETMKISSNDAELFCVTLESDEDYDNGKEVIVNFRIQFPYCRTDISYQENILRFRVITKLRDLNAISRLFHGPLNSWEEIIVPNVLTLPWPVYGSTTNPNYPRLQWSHIFSRIDSNHLETGDLPEMALEEIFDPRHHLHVKKGLIHMNAFNETYNPKNPKELIGDLAYWIPLFLSVNYWDGITMPDTDELTPNAAIGVINPVRRSNIPSTPRIVEMGHIDTLDAEVAGRLLSMLSRERMENLHYWKDVGKSLYNIYNGNSIGLGVWINFTEGSDAFSEEECRQLYRSFRYKNPLTLKTIAWYAKKDSPKAYREWHKEWCLDVMKDATTCTDTDVCHSLYRMYWLDFSCANLKKKSWYQFENHKWTKLDHGVTLKKIISGDFRRRYEKLRLNITRQIHESDDENFKNTNEVLLTKLNKLIRSLKMQAFKKRIMSEAAEQFYDAKFSEYIDKNPYLTGCMNGVIEVCGTYATMRDGKPEDYTSMCTGMWYEHDFTWDSPLVHRCMYWIRQCFMDEDLIMCFLKFCSSFLKGGNTDKIFPIFTGNGDNSKSMIKKLFEAALGAYCWTFPTEVLTASVRDSSKPRPEIAQASHARCVWAQEPNDGADLKTDAIKSFGGGGDTMFMRKLNDDGGLMSIMFTLILMCNNIPFIKPDKAIKSRWKIFPFLSTWVDDAPATEAEQFKQRRFPKDPDFESKIYEMAPAFLWIMVQMYQRYAEDGLGIPQIVKTVTNQFWEENDPYKLFTNECIQTAILPGTQEKDANGVIIKEGTPDVNAKMTASQVYQEFRHWYRDTYPQQKMPNRNVMKYELEQRWGKAGRGGWGGIRPVDNVAII